MKIAYFDCFSGVSGDMILGALVDLGADLDAIREGLSALPVTGYRLERREVKRCGIAATKIDVILEKRGTHLVGGSHHPHEHDPEHGRAYSEIETLLNESTLSGRVKRGAAEAYRRIADAEAHVHRRPVENIHFHEVGSIDAIVDVVGAFLALELLGVGEAWGSEITTGYGTVKTAHGIMPVPAPATAEILAEVPLRRGETESELVTPTGAAILRTACAHFGAWPDGFRTERVGYGAGSKEFPRQTNYLRVFLGHRVLPGGHDRTPASSDLAAKPFPSAPGTPPHRTQLLTLIQTEIDDMSGEVYSHLMKQLFGLGAYDVTLTAVQMKKNRPGVRVEVLCAMDKRDAVVNFLLRETTTFGVKIREVERVCLDRRFETVQTSYGPIRVKVGLLDGEVIKAAPEYEDCHRLAVEHQVPLLAVLEAARRAFEQRKP